LNLIDRSKDDLSRGFNNIAPGVAVIEEKIEEENKSSSSDESYNTDDELD